MRDAHLSQSPFDRQPFVLYPFGPRLAGSATLHVHTDGPVSAATSMVTETIGRHDPTLAILDAGSMDAAVRSQPLLVSVQLGATLIGSFGMLGLLLAAVGLYGVVSHAVVQRKQEFGIRTAPVEVPLFAIPIEFRYCPLGCLTETRHGRRSCAAPST